MPEPRVSGLSHMTFVVADLDAMEDILVAFAIDEAHVEHDRGRIMALGLDLREGRSRIAGEGRSLYFHDRDNHLFELHTGTLRERLAAYAGAAVDSKAEETSSNQ